MLKYLFITFQLFFFTYVTKAQYEIVPAFPNLAAFSRPIELLNAGDGSNRLFLVQQRGIIYVFNDSQETSNRKIFIDISSKVSQTYFDHGLLGMAFHPDYDNNHHFYVYFTFDSASTTAPFWSRVSRFTSSITDSDTALINTELILLTVPQPRPGHKGGKISFGPDGNFYISFGDGGIGGNPASNGQNKSTLLGKILRINLDDVSVGQKYSIPSTNPFFQNTEGFKEEIYAYGVRNIWKFNFDYSTGLLWAGEVGQSAYEEINLIENGKNYGWAELEGYHCYGNLKCDSSDTNFTPPIIEYPHDSGSAVTGGYVYRGSLHPDLYGKYIFGDYIQGKIWGLTYEGINPSSYVQLLDTDFGISTFGTDESNEIYFCKFSQTNGTIYKLSNLDVITLNLKVIMEAFYNSSTNTLNARDTVSVYLRHVSNQDSIADSSRIFIDSVSFGGLCFFQNAPSGNYYIMVKHRNSLKTWSKYGGEFLTGGNVSFYDFTSDSTNSCGNNLIRVDSNRYAIYSGDVNHDGVIDLSDMQLVDNAVYRFVSGYSRADINGDGFVDFTDLSVAEKNSRNFIAEIIP
ncbi:MAG: PQQ-dependent sugar dehydrogenase [Bacteroidota bacterium]|nr:PQQ-dependent sugar dehydrogenase [Bacteroidota bacterium]